MEFHQPTPAPTLCPLAIPRICVATTPGASKNLAPLCACLRLLILVPRLGWGLWGATSLSSPDLHPTRKSPDQASSIAACFPTGGQNPPAPYSADRNLSCHLDTPQACTTARPKSEISTWDFHFHRGWPLTNRVPRTPAHLHMSSSQIQNPIRGNQS
ncbi:hypothetical protein HJG60_009734 [Phyllostomus discolor]|uniref:Uncharacterized protein n=1 Tax=Phyllostomus discolor TaxID=89673 RepID=A0A834EQC3_9CHIR|nr:hypothetical protein HJG60_009734 [Phyllostomus discolor]